MKCKRSSGEKITWGLGWKPAIFHLAQCRLHAALGHAITEAWLWVHKHVYYFTFPFCRSKSLRPKTESQCQGRCGTLYGRFLFSLKKPAQGCCVEEPYYARCSSALKKTHQGHTLLQEDSFNLQLPQLREHLTVENNQKQKKGSHVAKDIVEHFPGGISRKNISV